MRRWMFLIALAPALVLAGPSLAKKPKKGQNIDDRIRYLMELTGAGDLGINAMEGTLEPMRQMLPQVPQEFWDSFMQKISPDTLVELVVPIYREHLNAKEVEALIHLYESKEGQHIIEVMPVIQAQAMQVGQAWGVELANQVVTQLQEEMPEVFPDMPPMDANPDSQAAPVTEEPGSDDSAPEGAAPEGPQ